MGLNFKLLMVALVSVTFLWGCGGHVRHLTVEVAVDADDRNTAVLKERALQLVREKKITDMRIGPGLGRPVHAYIGKNDELLRFSRQRETVSAGEEIIMVYPSSFLPDIGDASPEILSGKKAARIYKRSYTKTNGPRKGGHPNPVRFDRSRFTGPTPATAAVDFLTFAATAYVTGGLNVVLGAYSKKLKFFPEKFKQVVVDSGIVAYDRRAFNSASDFARENNRLVCQRFLAFVAGKKREAAGELVTIRPEFLERMAGQSLLNFQFSAHTPREKIGELVACCMEVYLEPAKSVDVASILPPEVSFPALPNAQRLTKDEFETLAQFKNRVQQAADQLETRREAMYLEYENSVAKRNQRVAELNAVHELDMKQMARQQTAKQRYLDWFRTQATRLALATVIRRLKIEAAEYDAETGTMFVSLPLVFGPQRLAAEMPVDRARTFKKHLADAEPIATYRVRGNALRLEGVAVKSGGRQMAMQAAGAGQVAPAAVSVDLRAVPRPVAAPDEVPLTIQPPVAYQAVKLEDFVVADSMLRQHLKTMRRPPQWFLDEDVNAPGKVIIGYGEGETKLEAKSKARTDIALALGKGKIQAGTHYRKVLNQWNGMDQTAIELETTVREDKQAVVLKELELVKIEYVLGRYYVAMAFDSF